MMKLFVYMIDEYSEAREHYDCCTLSNMVRHDSGVDIMCPREYVVPPKTMSFKIKLGIRCKVEFEDGKPRGYYLLPRSSLGSKTPLRQSNSIGLIDFGYRAECMLLVDNMSDIEYVVKKGDRLCQIVSPDLSPIEVCVLNTPDELETTVRNFDGFGSTGS